MSRLIDRADLFNRLSTVKTLDEVFATIQNMPPAEPKQVLVIQVPRGMLFSPEDYLALRKNILSQMQEGLVIISAETEPFVINKDSSVEIREETTT